MKKDYAKVMTRNKRRLFRQKESLQTRREQSKVQAEAEVEAPEGEVVEEGRVMSKGINLLKITRAHSNATTVRSLDTKRLVAGRKRRMNRKDVIKNPTLWSKKRSCSWHNIYQTMMLKVEYGM